MDIRESKMLARREAMLKRDSLDFATKSSLDASICKNFLNTLAYHHCSSIIFYSSKDKEISTHDMIVRALDDGKTVALPRCIVERTEMEFYRITSLGELVEGSYGISEPDPERCEKVNAADFDVCVIPALCYDRHGYRIGYGKGYYDRFLQGFSGVKVGLAYHHMLKERLPKGRYDRRVDMIVTDKGVINVEAKG